MYCPNCGEPFKEENIIFMGFDECNCKVSATYETHCPNCGKDWRWEDVYEYTDSIAPYQVYYDHL